MTHSDPLHNSDNWFKTSAALAASAKLLWPKASSVFGRKRIGRQHLRDFEAHAPAFLLLSALAVENALKGALVGQLVASGRTPNVSSRAKWSDPNRVWGHDLPALAKQAGLKMDPDDDELLNTLKRTIEWAGRYPAAGEVGAYFIPRYGSDDWKRIRTLLRRIKRM